MARKKHRTRRVRGSIKLKFKTFQNNNIDVQVSVIKNFIAKIDSIIADSVEVLFQERVGQVLISYSIENYGVYEGVSFKPHILKIELFKRGMGHRIEKKFRCNSEMVSSLDVNILFKIIPTILYSRIKGVKNEMRINEIIDRLSQEQESFHNVTMNYAMPAGVYTDKGGIDVQICVTGQHARVLVPLQIKSSRDGQEKHILKHSHIPSIFVEGKNEKEIEEALFLITSTYVYGKKGENVLHL